MADNIKYPGPGVSLLVTLAGASSGDPVEIGEMHGVALEDTGESVTGKATVKFPYMFVADLSVEAVDGAVDNAVVIGDALYYDSAETIKVNKDETNGLFFGYATEAIAAGSDDTIEVLVAGGMGAGESIQHAVASAKLDLSGAAQANVIVLHSTVACQIVKAVFVYTEASSADAGVKVDVGKESDADYYYTGDSAVSKSAWDEVEVALLKTDLAAGDTIVVANAGGKTGTGEILVWIEYIVE